MEYKQGNLPTWYGKSSSQRLGTCTEQFQTLFNALAADGWDISIFCGHRGEEDQNKAYFDHKSNAKWPDSYHNAIPSKGIDAGPYIQGEGTPGYGDCPNDDAIWIIFAGAVMSKAQEMGIKLRWGGLFTGLKDLAHFELV